MSIDLVRNWNGTFSIGEQWVHPGLVDGNGNSVDQSGAPTSTYNVTLKIEWQGDFEQFFYSMASPFYGYLDGYDPIDGINRVPISGFLNEQGYISFNFYTDKQPVSPDVIQVAQYWNFEAFIQTHGGFHTMSGEWLETAWQNHYISYRFGNLNVTCTVSFRERIQWILTKVVMLFK